MAASTVVKVPLFLKNKKIKIKKKSLIGELLSLAAKEKLKMK